MDAAGNAGGGLAVWFFPIVSAGRCPGSIMQKKKPVRLDSRAGFRAVWGPDRVGLRVLHSFQRGLLGV